MDTKRHELQEENRPGMRVLQLACLILQGSE